MAGAGELREDRRVEAVVGNFGDTERGLRARKRLERQRHHERQCDEAKRPGSSNRFQGFSINSATDRTKIVTPCTARTDEVPRPFSLSREVPEYWEEKGR